MGWWFYDYVLKEAGPINWPRLFTYHLAIIIARKGGFEVTKVFRYVMVVAVIWCALAVLTMITVGFFHAIGLWPEEWVLR